MGVWIAGECAGRPPARVDAVGEGSNEVVGANRPGESSDREVAHVVMHLNSLLGK